MEKGGIGMQAGTKEGRRAVFWQLAASTERRETQTGAVHTATPGVRDNYGSYLLGSCFEANGSCSSWTAAGQGGESSCGRVPHGCDRWCDVARSFPECESRPDLVCLVRLVRLVGPAVPGFLS